MNHDQHLSGWPLVWSWIANAALWLTYGMNPLQAISTFIVIGFSLHRWWLMKKRGKPTE
jgi:hypothetical protein